MIHGVVSVIIPTGGRKTLGVAIDSFCDTTHDYPVELILSVDADEDTYHDLCDWWVDDSYFSIRVYSSRGKGAISAWNDGLLYAQGEYVVMAADDLVFKENWLEEAMAKMAILPQGIGVVGFNDLHNGERHQTHFLFHRRFILDYMGGVLCIPHYKHFQVDSEIIARAAKVGCYIYAANSIVQHDHWANNRRPADKWDESVAPFFKEDEALFVKRKAMGFPNDYDAVIKE